MVKGEFVNENVPIVKVAIASGQSVQTPFIGISFLKKFNYKAIVDCKHKTVVLKRVS